MCCNYLSISRLGKNVAGIPGWPVYILCNKIANQEIKLCIALACLKIKYPVNIILRFVVIFCTPWGNNFTEIIFTVDSFIAIFHMQGGYAVHHETILIAPGKSGLFWLGIGFNTYPKIRGRFINLF